MAELPSPPSLDLDGAPADGAPVPTPETETPGKAQPKPAPERAAAAKPKPVPAPEPAPAKPAQPPPPPPDEADEPAKIPTQRADAQQEPKAVPAPEQPPESSAMPRVTGVVDSVEEVLQQTSAQTLRLSHLEDILTALNQTLTDLQDEMHAGFAEIRAVTESVATGEGTRPTEIAGGESLNPRLEFVEEQTLETNKKQGLLTILAVVQGVLLIILLIVALVGAPSSPTTEIPAATYTASPRPTEVEVKKPPPPPVEEPRKKKRRRKR